VRRKSQDSEDTSSIMTGSTSADPAWDSQPSFPEHMEMDTDTDMEMNMDKNVGSASFPAFPTYDDSAHISATANKSQDFGAFSPFSETAGNKSSVESKQFSDFFLVTEEKQQQQLSEGIRQSPSNDAPSLADASSHSDSESEEGSISFATGGAGQAGIISSITNRIWGVETPVIDDHHGTTGVSEQSELTLDQTDLNDLGADSQAEPPETSTPQTAQQDQQQEYVQSEDDLLRFEADDFDSWSKTSLSSCSDMELDGFVNKPKASINWPNPDDHAIEEETEFDLVSRASSKASKSSKASSKKKKKKKKKTKSGQKETKSPPEDLRNSWSESSGVFQILQDEQLKKNDSEVDSEQGSISNSWNESSGVLGILQDDHELDNDVNAMPLKKNDSGVDSEQELGNVLSSNDTFYEAAQEEEIIEKEVEEEEGDSSSVESITKSYRYLQDSLKQMESVDDEDDQEDEQSMHRSLAGLVTAIRGEASVVSDDAPPIPISSPAEDSKEPLEEDYDDAQSIASEQSDRLYNNLIATLNGISSGYGKKKGNTSSDFSASKTTLTESAASLDHGDFNSALEEEDEDPSPEAYAIMEGPFDDISHSAFTAASKVSALTNNTLDDLDDSSMSHRSWGSRGSRGSRSRRSYGTISIKSSKSSLRSSVRSRRSSGSKSVTFGNLYTPEIFHYDDRSVDSGSSTVSDELKSDPYDTKMYSLKKADKPRSTIADSILEDMANEPLVPRRQKRVDGRNERNIMTEVLSKLKRTRDRLGLEEDSIVSSSNITLEFDSEELFIEVVAKLDRIRKLLDSSSYCEYSVDGGETKSEDESLINVSYDL